MEVPRIEAEQLLPCHRVAHVKFVRADDVGFRADAEQLALDRVAREGGINFLGKNGVERFFQALPRTLSVDRQVL